MSRAFVKEPDGEQPETLPELPLSPHPNYVTPGGLAQLRQRLAKLNENLASIAKDAADAEQQRAVLAREIRWIQARLAAALPITEPLDRQRVGFGAEVTLLDEQERRYRYRIVGEDEADAEHGLISWISPLARALDGAQVGDVVNWPRPAGELDVEIVAIDYPAASQYGDS